jgi:Tol biopolymer transport system component
MVLAATCILSASAQAAFPGNNGKIAFASERDSFYTEIYTINPDGTGVARLTDLPYTTLQPDWSPDGKKIAFMSENLSPRAFHFDIYTMDADGANQTRLTDYPEWDVDPAWSPDGTKIAFARFLPPRVIPPPLFDIHVMNADGTGVSAVTAGPGYDRSPVWSPDGTTVAFSRHDADTVGGPGGLFLMKPDGADLRQLTYGSSDSFPDWSPDGSKIVFASNVSPPAARQNPEVFTINADGSGEQRLTYSDKEDLDPVWSPDGTKIAFTSYREDSRGDIWVMNADGSDQRLLAGMPGVRDVSESWQPIPGPQRSDYKNAAHFCKAEHDFLGDASFRQKYGGGANAYGKCVSAK